MNTAAKGRAREHSVRRQFERLGFIVFRSPGSKGIDLFAIHKDRESGYPHVAVEVGGKDKSIRGAFAKLRRQNVPGGTMFVVARCVNRRWIYHVNEDDGFTDLGVALELT